MNICKSCGFPSKLPFCPNCFIPLYSSDEERVSFAYQQKIPKYAQFNQVKVLDLYGTNLITCKIENFLQLKQLRISHCGNIKSIFINNAPCLTALDATTNKMLESISISNSDEILAFDCSFSEKLSVIPESFANVQYFSVRHTRVSKPPDIPNAIYIDISSTIIPNFDIYSNCQKLEILIAENMKNINEIDLGPFTYLHRFHTIQTNIKNVSFVSSSPNTHLKRLWLADCENVDKIPQISNYCALLPGNEMTGESFQKIRVSSTWRKAHRLLYGPWPVPQIDLEKGPAVNAEFQVPPEYDPKIATEHIAGAIFGVTIGDSLALHCDRSDTSYVNFVLDSELDITWSHPRMSRRGITFYRGCITSNSALMMLVMRSFIDTKGKIDVTDISKKIKKLISNGIPERRETNISESFPPSLIKVSRNPKFENDPFLAAREYWETSGKTASGNGGIIRSTPVGCLCFWRNFISNNADMICRITQFDTRCAFSASCYALLISNLIKSASNKNYIFDLDATINDAMTYFPNFTEVDRDEINRYIRVESLQQLRLDSYLPITLQALGCAIWVLRQNLSFIDAIDAVFHAGGDIQTNVSVVSGVMGAKYGFKHIPIDLLEYFWFGGLVYKELNQFLSLMGLKFDLPTIDDFESNCH